MPSLIWGGRDPPSCLGDSKTLETGDALLLVHHVHDHHCPESDQGEDTDGDDPCLRRENEQGNIQEDNIMEK